jgi:xylulokinase
VAFGLADSLDLLRALGVEAATARVSGGGARSRLWLEIVASVLGVPLELTESEEGSALGAALLGGVAGGVFRDVDEAVARCVRVKNTVEPDTAWSDTYREAHERYRALYPALRAARVPA